MDFEKIELSENNLEMAYISRNSGGYISRNKHLFNKIDLNEVNVAILNKAVFGTPIFKFGSGGNRVLILSGVHGDELPSQIASLNLINELINQNLNNTVYIIPFAAPYASMNNKRKCGWVDLNRVAHAKDSLSRQIIETIKDLKIQFVGDFHSAALGSNPGREAVFSSRFPCIESFLIASYISQNMGSEVIDVEKAGSIFRGSIEDECNLNLIPTVTCEVLSPFGKVGEGSIQRASLQMKSFLRYFGI